MNNKPRIFHGPENICGIGGKLAQWQRKNYQAESRFIVFQDNTAFQNSDLNIHTEKIGKLRSIKEKVSLFLKSIHAYDIFHFYFGKSFLPFNLDLPILKIFNKKIIMHYLGSDIRINSLQARNNAYYSYSLIPKNLSQIDFLKKARMYWQQLWFDYCIVGKDLLIHARQVIKEEKIIHNIWVGRSVVPSQKLSKKSHEGINIVHAPTNRGLKGTKYIEEAVEKLKIKGISVNLHLLENLPHKELMRFIGEEADIVIDQLLNGAFGVISIESLSLGVPVICFLSDDILKEFPEIPIVNANIDNLPQVLEELIENQDFRSALSEKGISFVDQNFNFDIFSNYPKIKEKPIEVFFINNKDKKLIYSILLTDNESKKINIRICEDSFQLQIFCDLTWIPNLLIDSSDSRELGIGIFNVSIR